MSKRTTKRDLNNTKQEDNEFYRLIVESLEDYAVFTTDTKGVISSWNKGAEHVLGYKEKEIIGKSAEILFTPEDLQKKAHKKELNTALKQGRATDERWHVRKDGTRFWASGLVFPLKDGSLKGFTKIMRNITDRKDLEESLKMQSQVLDSMIEGVSVSDENGFIVYTNPIEDKLFGYKKGELIGKHVSIQNDYPPGENKVIVGQVIHQLKTKGYWFGEWKNKKKDGTSFITSSRITMIELSGKKHFVCVQEDITEHKRAEEELHTRVRQQAAVTELGLKALSGVDLRSLMNEAVVKLHEDLNVEYTKVLELLPGGKEVILRAGVGWNKNIIVDKSTVDTGKNSQAGYTLLSKHPVIVKDLPNEKRFNGPALLRNHRVVSGMSCVIWKRNKKPYGVLGIHTKQRRDFTKDDVNFLQAVANVLAMAIQRKEDEAALVENEEQFRQLAETIPHIVFSSNIDGSIDYINQKWFDYTGSRKDFASNSWSSSIHPDDLPNVLAVWEQARKNGESYEAEYRLQRHDGIYRWFVARSSPIKNYNGDIIRWFGTATDIDDRKQSEKNFRFLAEASKILSTSLDYRTTLNNIANIAVPEIADWCAIDLLDGKGGLERVAIVHKDPKKVKWAKELHKKNPPDLNAPTGIPKVIRTGKAEFYPYISDEFLVKVAKDKEHLKLLRNVGLTSAMIVPLFREGKCIGGITFASAEAKRQYTESDIKMTQELASRASMAIENAWLYQGSQDAIALRDNFISVASHELKTPVTSVKIFTQVLQQHSEQIGDEMAKKQLVRMDKQLNKLIELIYDLLNVSKIQAGRMEFKQKVYDFDASIKEIVEVLQEGATKHKILIKGKTNKKVYADEERIGQVLSNLLSNAIKYSPKADKVVVRLSSDSNNVHVCVEDFGIGLAQEHLGRIFERFYRVFDTTDKTFPGLGIGLYISSEIIRRHHGRLWVESDTGKGSNFHFTLPLTRDKKPNGIQVL